MKNSKAITKIVIWSTIAISLTLFMIFISISGDFVDFFTYSFGGNDQNTKTIRKTKFEVTDLNSIDMEWNYGNVYISSYDGDMIIIDERSNRDLTEDELLNLKQENGTLYLSQKSHNIFSFFGSINRKVVRYITLPSKLYDKINADFTSGSLVMDGIETSAFNLKMTSGNTDVTDTTSKSLNVDITSGNVEINGAFEEIEAYATSGNVKITTNIVPSNLLIDITSGNAAIAIPDNDGFMLSKEKTSGLFRSEFKLDEYNTYKNGQNKYRVRMTSGIVSLLKAD